MDLTKKNQNTILFKRRISDFRKRFSADGIDTCLVFKTENIYYITGFFAKDSGSVLVITNKKVSLLVHFMFFEKAKKPPGLIDDIELVMFTSDRNDKLSSVISGTGGKTVAVEGSSITYNSYTEFSGLLKKQHKKIKNLPGYIEESRTIKDENEISLIKKSCNINDDALMHILNKPIEDIKSFTEIGLMLEIEKKMVELGASGKSFDMIVATGKSSSLPHHASSRSKIKDGPLLMDLGCRFGNYCSDITRSVFLGKNGDNTKLKKIYDIVLQAQIKALDSCRAGIAASELDSIARHHIEKEGYGDYFGHGLGHGVGLEVHEEPGLSRTSESILKENMVITIEPGIYLQGTGGIRIEDMVIVKKNGCENLYDATKTLTVIK